MIISFFYGFLIFGNNGELFFFDFLINELLSLSSFNGDNYELMNIFL